MRQLDAIPRTRAWGIGLAFGTALVSGVAVFVNSYGVRRVPDATVYTTAKNLAAAVLLVGLIALVTSRRAREGWTPPRNAAERVGLLAVAVVGGSIPFVLFFEGLARASSAKDAAFLHKTLVVWVVLLAVPLLRERLGPAHVGAIALLVWGQAEIAGGVSPRAGDGEAMILGATLLWAVEVVVAKRLLSSLSSLTVGVSRMAGGSVVLIGWVGVTSRLDDLAGLAASQWGWALLTGVLLAAYVATWYAALARAQAVDVTAALVAGALVTAALDAAVVGTPLRPQAAGLALVAAGAGLVALVALFSRRPAGELAP